MLTVEERFWSKVDKTGECWVWTAGKKDYGYGQFSIGYKKIRAHRWAYETLVGPIPDGLTIDHLCRNPSCVNPDHLEAVPGAENTRRGGNALKTHCPRGHEYDEKNTRHCNGMRFCRTCDRDLHRERAARLRLERQGGE